MSKRLAGLAALGCLCIAGDTARAQGGPHSGFHASVGLGTATGKLDCTSCGGDSQQAGALMLRFGGAVGPKFVLSGELGGWGSQLTSNPRKASWILATAQYYPVLASGFFAKVGVGEGSFESTWVPPGGPRTLKTQSRALALGVGYDIPVRGGFSITPYLDALSIWRAAPTNGDSAERGMSLGSFGIAFSWR